MTAILGRTGNLVGFSTGRGTTPWDTEMEAALRKMDAMLASTVVAITNTLPGSANEGDLFLVGTLPTGVAAGWANRIARWRSSPAGWEAYQPMQGWIITIVGESTNKVRRYNGTAWVALAADAGAEPYAGAPAQTSFWRSTAAGVRAWVQLVAADITDLATVLAGYLTKANPDFTGALKQGGATLITSGGDAWFASIQSTNLLGAGDRPVAADLTGTLQPKTPDQFRNMIFALASSLKGAANGVAELGADGRVPTTQLPSYVDDVLEFASFAAFPATGETGKIYINLDQNKTWRWSGSGYTEISASLALGETSATAYPGDLGKIAYTHSQIAAGNPHGTTAADVGAMAAANPGFTGALKQGGTTRITSSGGADFASLRVSNLSNAFSGVLTSDYVGVIGVRGAADFRDNYIQAAASDHNHFSKLDVSASTTIGSIDATAIKVTATDVNLTLSGGVNGQGWDIVCPTTSFGISIPAGVTLYAYAGSDIGPKARAVGGGRGIRIVRIDAATWIAPNMTW